MNMPRKAGPSLLLPPIGSCYWGWGASLTCVFQTQSRPKPWNLWGSEFGQLWWNERRL